MTKEFFERGKQIAKWADKHMTKDEAMQQAIDFLDGSYEAHAVRKALQEALTQPAQEPDAWMNDEGFGLYPTNDSAIPLYTHPAPLWQGLSDDEIQIIQDNSWIIHSSEHKEFNTFKFASAIEQALKEKNT